MGSLSILHWLIVLVIVVLVFGTRKLPNIGKDLGNAVRGFRDGMKSEQEKSSAAPNDTTAQPPPAANEEQKK